MASIRSLILIISLTAISACGHLASQSTSFGNSIHVPISFQSSKEEGQFGLFCSIPCTIDDSNGNCIFDTGANTSLVASTSETKDFKILYKAKVVSGFGQRIEDVVQVPKIILARTFMKKDFPAVRSNAFHDLPDYLAVLGADILLGSNFIYDLGTDENNPAKLILDPRPDEVSARGFKYFDSLFLSERFIFLKLSIDGVYVKAMWDTHLGKTGFSEKFIRTHPGFFKQLDIQNHTDSSRMNGSTRYFQLLKPICITPQFCPYTTGSVMELGIGLADNSIEPLDVILGNDFIWNFHWYFNFKEQKFSVQPR